MERGTSVEISGSEFLTELAIQLGVGGLTENSLQAVLEASGRAEYRHGLLSGQLHWYSSPRLAIAEYFGQWPNSRDGSDSYDRAK